MKERRTKDELVGKISECCRRLGREVPFGLGTASTDALRRHLDTLKQQIASRGSANLQAAGKTTAAAAARV
jgi:hypothetical protein